MKLNVYSVAITVGTLARAEDPLSFDRIADTDRGGFGALRFLLGSRIRNSLVGEAPVWSPTLLEDQCRCRMTGWYYHPLVFRL